MYNAFFGFTQNPFNMSPDPSFLFRSTQHEEALANLIYGVQSRKGFIALTGEQELDRKLEAPEFRQLKQRIALRCTLRGLTPQETIAYVNSRMSHAGLKDQTVIPPELIEEISHRTQGIPRLINAICDNLLLTAFAMECRLASLQMIDEVTADMRLDY